MRTKPYYREMRTFNIFSQALLTNLCQISWFPFTGGGVKPTQTCFEETVDFESFEQTQLILLVAVHRSGIKCFLVISQDFIVLSLRRGCSCQLWCLLSLVILTPCILAMMSYSSLPDKVAFAARPCGHSRGGQQASHFKR